MSEQQSAHKPLTRDGVIAGNVYDKYQTGNPIAAWMMGRFLDAVTELADQCGAADIHEVGCGEGYLSQVLSRPGRRVRGTDNSEQIIAEARELATGAGLDIPFQVASIYELDRLRDSAELVVCCEVLEHLEHPEQALEVISRLARPHVLVSVPREPLWRVLNMARGKYLADLGNTPGHLQHWSRRSFLGLLGQHLEVVKVLSPVPWTVALCRVRD